MFSKERRRKLEDDLSVMLETFWREVAALGGKCPHCDENHGGLADEVGLAAVKLIDVELVWIEHRPPHEEERLLEVCFLASPVYL